MKECKNAGKQESRNAGLKSSIEDRKLKIQSSFELRSTHEHL